MNKVFICPSCNRKFNRKYNLNRHLQKKNSCVKKEKKIFCSISSYQNIPKYTDPTPKYTKIYQNIPKQEQIEDQSTLVIDNGCICEYCNRSYKKKFTLNRHLKTCKVKKEKEKEKENESSLELKIELAKQQIEILKLQAQVASSNTNCNNTNTTSNSNNTVNNNTVNITVNDYGKENINYLESNKYKKLITQILGSGMHGLQEYIKYKYCNPQQPENLTIKYTNDRSNNLKVRTNNEWKTRNKLEVIDELYDRDNNVEEVLNVYERINDLEDGIHMDKIQEHFVDEINKYYNQDEDDNDDKEVEEEMRRMKNKTLNHFYDCFKNNKEKFDPNSVPN
jgi:hypothetical protein